MREIKFKIIYQSPNTDEPNKLLISEPLSIQDIMFSEDTQVDFTDGGYLRFNELEEEYTKFIQYTGLLDKNKKEIYSGYRLKCEDLYVTVKWRNDTAGFIFEDDDGRDIAFYTKDYVCEHFEIINDRNRTI